MNTPNPTNPQMSIAADLTQLKAADMMQNEPGSDAAIRKENYGYPDSQNHLDSFGSPIGGFCGRSYGSWLVCLHQLSRLTSSIFA